MPAGQRISPLARLTLRRSLKQQDTSGKIKTLTKIFKDASRKITRK
jgi:hypothetical protein